MRKILVTAISGNIGYGILKVLKSLDNILYGCDVNEIAAGMDLVEQFWQCKYAVEDGYLEELLEKCRQYEITHLIPVNEREIEVIGKERKRFEEIQVKVLIQSQRILDICLDKYATAEFLSKHGFLVPETFKKAEEIVAEDKCYICKPRRSNGSKDIFIFHPKENGAAVCKTGKKCIFQEYIESDEEYTVGVFRHKEIINTIVFLRQLKNGYSSQVELKEDEEIQKIAEGAAHVFELEGYFNIQLRKKDGRYYIFEINPRISGTVRFRHMLGYTDVLWWLDLLDGRDIMPYHNKYHRAIGIRELNEKYLILE